MVINFILVRAYFEWLPIRFAEIHALALVGYGD